MGADFGARPLVSFVIPCYRSAKTIIPVVTEIEAYMRPHREYDFEVVTVVDGSPDNVFDVLCEASAAMPFLKVISFTRNYGQASAKAAGYDYAQGDYIVTLDDDGQCPVEHVFEMLDKINAGADLVVARYGEKKQSAFKNFGSAVNQAMTHHFTDLPKDFVMSNFFVFNRVVADALKQQHNPYPFLSAAIARITDKIDYVKMGERSRLSGTTTYTFKKMLALWANGFIGFSEKPMRLSFFAGVLFGVLFAISLIAMIVAAFVGSFSSGYVTVSLFCLVACLLFIQLGLMGEYLARVLLNINGKPTYSIRTMINIR